MLEMFNTLLRQLRLSIDYALTGSYDGAVSLGTKIIKEHEECMFQEAVIKTIGVALEWGGTWGGLGPGGRGEVPEMAPRRTSVQGSGKLVLCSSRTSMAGVELVRGVCSSQAPRVRPGLSESPEPSSPASQPRLQIPGSERRTLPFGLPAASRSEGLERPRGVRRTDGREGGRGGAMRNVYARGRGREL